MRQGIIDETEDFLKKQKAKGRVRGWEITITSYSKPMIRVWQGGAECSRVMSDIYAEPDLRESARLAVMQLAGWVD